MEQSRPAKKTKYLRRTILLLCGLIFSGLAYFYVTRAHNNVVDSFVASYHLSGSQLNAGSAKVPLILPEGTILAGYRPFRQAEGKLSPTAPLETRAIYLNASEGGPDNGAGILLVSVDVIGLPGPLVEKMRKALGALGVDEDRVFLFASHTHNGPDTIGLWGGIEEQTEALLIDGVVKAATKARSQGKRAIARFRSKVSNVPAINRRKIGTPLDPNRISVLEFKYQEEEGGIALVVYGAHPVALGTKNLLPSSDYVGLLLQQLAMEKNYEFHFLNGALGNVNPPQIEPGQIAMDDHQGLATNARDFSHHISQEVLELLIDTEPVESADIEVRTVDFVTSIKHLPMAMVNALGIVTANVDDLGNLRAPVTRISLGHKVHLLTAPGEVVTTYLEKFAKDIGYFPVVLSLCNDTWGYFLPEDAIRPGGGTEETMIINPDVGDRWYQTALDLTKGLPHN